MTAARRSSSGAVTAAPMQFRVSGSPAARSLTCIGRLGRLGEASVSREYSPCRQHLVQTRRRRRGFSHRLPTHRVHKQSVPDDRHGGVGDARVRQQRELWPETDEAGGKLLAHLHGGLEGCGGRVWRKGGEFDIKCHELHPRRFTEWLKRKGF